MSAGLHNGNRNRLGLRCRCVVAQPAHQAVEEIRLPDRLRERAREAGLRGVGRRDPPRRAEHELVRTRDRRVGVDRARQLQPVHVRHVQVEHHNLVGVAALRSRTHELECAHGVGRLVGAHPPGPELLPQDQAVRGVVVDDQGPQRIELGNLHVRVLLPILLAQRNLDPEGASPVDHALHAHRAPHQLHELLDDRQPEAGAAEPARRRRVGLREGVEQPLEIVGGDAYARVDHVEAELDLVLVFVEPTDAHDDLALSRELHRVRREVDEHLSDSGRVTGALPSGVPSGCAPTARRSSPRRRRRASRRRLRPAHRGRSRLPRSRACPPRPSRSRGCR